MTDRNHLSFYFFMALFVYVTVVLKWALAVTRKECPEAKERFPPRSWWTSADRFRDLRFVRWIAWELQLRECSFRVRLAAYAVRLMVVIWLLGVVAVFVETFGAGR